MRDAKDIEMRKGNRPGVSATYPENDLAGVIPDPRLRAIAVSALLSPDPVAYLKQAADSDTLLLVRLLACVVDVAEDN